TIYNFRTLSDTKLDTEAENVYTKLTDNADFPSPMPELTVLETHLSEYREALAEAALGDREKVILKNRKRGQLEHTLRSLALYVEHAADGDEALILTAGFSLRKTTQGGSDTPFV